MEMKDIKKEYYDNLINDYVEGRARIRGDHPEEITKAIDSFFHAGKMLVDHPEIESIPTEYVEKLLSSLAQYPEYHSLLIDLLQILEEGKGK